MHGQSGTPQLLETEPSDSINVLSSTQTQSKQQIHLSLAISCSLRLASSNDAATNHEHQRGRRRRDRDPHRRRGPRPRQGPGRGHGASSSRRSSVVSGGTRSCDDDGASEDGRPVLPARRPRQPVRGAPRLRAEGRCLRARPRRGHRHGHLRRDALRLHPVLPVPRPLRRLPGAPVLHGGQRDRGGVPGAVPPLLRRHRPPPTGHRLAPPPPRLRHDHSGAADGRGGGSGGDRGPGALGEPARQLGAHLHAVSRLLPAHQRRRRGIVPRRARPLIPRHLGRLRHQETLNWMISALMWLHAYVLLLCVASCYVISAV